MAFTLLVSASTLHSFVRIVAFHHKWLRFGVFERSVETATLAAMALLLTVDKLLLGKRIKLTCLDEHGSFNGASR